MNDLLALVGAKCTSPSSARREHRPNEVEIATRAAKASAGLRGTRAAEGGILVFKCQDIIHNHKMHCTNEKQRDAEVMAKAQAKADMERMVGGVA